MHLEFSIQHEIAQVIVLDGTEQFYRLYFITINRLSGQINIASYGLEMMFDEDGMITDALQLDWFKFDAHNRIKGRIADMPNNLYGFLLKVAPDTPRKEFLDSNSGHGSKKAFHMVRGHFRTYHDHPHIPDQTVFVRPHTRGHASLGTIDKGYKIVLEAVE